MTTIFKTSADATTAVPVMTFEVDTPLNPERQDGYYYALRAVRYRDNAIDAIYERDYYHTTPTAEAVADLITWMGA